jgi:hypothetical protein
VGLGLHRVELLVGQADQRPGHAHQQRLAQPLQHVGGDLAGVMAGAAPLGHRGQGGAGVALAQGLDEGPDRRRVVVDPAGGGHLVEHRQGVAHRALAPAGDEVNDLGGHVEAGVGSDPLQVLRQQVERQEAELEVLGAAADGGQHLLRLGRRQHEDHVARGLLEGLEQGGGRVVGQHVDLVDDVDLPAPWRAERGSGHELPHGVDAPVGGGVELHDIERAALGDADARLAGATRLAVVRVRAVEGLGQDAGGRRLPRAPGPAEEVGVRHAALADRVAQRLADVVLTLELGPPLGAVSPVERLVGHEGRQYPPARTLGPWRQRPPTGRR